MLCHESLESTWPHQKWILEAFTKKPTSIWIHVSIRIYNYTTLCKYIIVILYLLFIYIGIELHIHYFTMLEKMLTHTTKCRVNSPMPSDHMQQSPPCTVDDLSTSHRTLDVWGSKSFPFPKCHQNAYWTQTKKNTRKQQQMPSKKCPTAFWDISFSNPSIQCGALAQWPLELDGIVE